LAALILLRRHQPHIAERDASRSFVSSCRGLAVAGSSDAASLRFEPRYDVPFAAREGHALSGAKRRGGQHHFTRAMLARPIAIKVPHH